MMYLTRVILLYFVLLVFFTVIFVEVAPKHCTCLLHDKTPKANHDVPEKPELNETPLKFRIGNSTRLKYGFAYGKMIKLNNN